MTKLCSGGWDSVGKENRTGTRMGRDRTGTGIGWRVVGQKMSSLGGNGQKTLHPVENIPPSRAWNGSQDSGVSLFLCYHQLFVIFTSKGCVSTPSSAGPTIAFSESVHSCGRGLHVGSQTSNPAGKPCRCQHDAIRWNFI